MSCSGETSKLCFICGNIYEPLEGGDDYYINYSESDDNVQSDDSEDDKVHRDYSVHYVYSDYSENETVYPDYSEHEKAYSDDSEHESYIEDSDPVDPDYKIDEKLLHESQISSSCSENNDSDDFEESVSPAKKRKTRYDLLKERKRKTKFSDITLFRRGSIKSGCKQLYDKCHYCTFCVKQIACKIAKHLVTVHRDKPRVSALVQLPKQSIERRNKLQLLENEGNFKHNVNVIKAGEGKLVVARRDGRTNDLYDHSDFLPCQYCLKFLLKHTLWIHQNSCPFNSMRKNINKSGHDEEATENDQTRRNAAVRTGRMLLHSALLDNSDKLCNQLLSRMRDDDVKEIVRKDKLLLSFAALRMEGLGDEEDQKVSDIHRVSQGVRTLGRLILEAKKTTLCNLDSLIKPNNFDLVVSSSKSMTFEKENPSLTLGKYLGNLISHVIETKLGSALRHSNDEKLEEAQRFRTLFKSEWNYRVNCVAEKKINKRKRSSVQTIPLISDLHKLREHIEKSMADTYDALKFYKLPCDWSKLAKLTLCRLIMFNKRRRSEVREITVEDYVQRPSWHEEQHGEMEMALSVTDKLLATR